MSKKKPGYWNEERVRACAALCFNKSEFKLRFYGAYKKATISGFIDQLFPYDGNKMPIRKWSEDSIRVEAAKYTTKRELEVGNASAYNAANKRFPGLLSELFGTVKTQPIVKWNRDSVIEEASKHLTKKVFAQKSHGAYVAARRLGILDKLGFKDGSPSDNNAIYIWRAISQHYNGNPVYKIGVTSARLGIQRIETVADKSGFEFDLICCEPVACKATELERKLLMLGEDPQFIGFDGCTEFRALSDSALYAAISMICGAM